MNWSAQEAAARWHAWAHGEWAEGRTGPAEQGFLRALAADPAALPPRLALAALLLERGDLVRSHALLDAAPAAASERPETLLLRGRLASAQRDPHEARHVLERMLALPAVAAGPRAEASLLLGLALEQLGDDAGAFAAAARGKALQREIHAAEARSREGEVAKLRRVTGWLGEVAVDWATPLPIVAGPEAAATHVFLLGFPRTGTTLLEQMLAAHPAVRTLEEEPTLAAATRAFLSDADACAALARLGGEEATAWVRHYWRTIGARLGPVAGRCFVDKQPAGTMLLPLIARLFPRARILFAIRDPRDVVLSCFRQAFRMNAMTYAFTDLAETAACYDACMTLAEEARARLPLAWLDVRHETLVEDSGAVLGRLLPFLGLPPHPALADVAQSALDRPIRTPSAAQVRAGLNPQGIGRWRRFAGDLAPVLPTLAPWVERFGYPV